MALKAYSCHDMGRVAARRFRRRIKRSAGSGAGRNIGPHGLLKQFGPALGRPRVDTLKGSRHANMKELRFDAADGVWRVAFAFNPKRRAILLVGGDKSGGSEKRFYRLLIKKADARFDEHVTRLETARRKGNG